MAIPPGKVIFSFKLSLSIFSFHLTAIRFTSDLFINTSYKTHDADSIKMVYTNGQGVYAERVE